MKRLLVSVAAGAMLLAGCSVRLDTPDPTVPAASASEVVRQREALRSEVLTDCDDDALAADAAAQLAALGGVWEAWPEGDGPSDAPAAATPDISADTGALELLQLTTPDLASAAVDATEADEALLYASIYAARTARLLELGGTLEAAWPTQVRTSSPDLIRALDASAWVLEVYAAQGQAQLDDAQLLREWSQRNAENLGVAGTAEDPRAAAYSVTPLPALADVWGALLEELIAAVPASSDRAGMLQAVAVVTGYAVDAGYAVGALPALASN